MADESNLSPNSIELKDFTKDLKSDDDDDDEQSIDLNEISDNENKDDKVREPLLQNESLASTSKVANQSNDPSATHDQVEAESLLIHETNIDNLDEIQTEVNAIENQHRSDTQAKIPKLDFKSVAIVIGTGTGFLFLFLVLIVLIPSCIDSLDYTEVYVYSIKSYV